MNSEVISQELKAFIVEISGVKAGKINPAARLVADLGIWGDDAAEFIAAFARRFDVDISKFVFADYFEAEADAVLPAIIKFLAGRPRSQTKALTVWHLQKAIRAGKLDQDLISA